MKVALEPNTLENGNMKNLKVGMKNTFSPTQNMLLDMCNQKIEVKIMH